MTEVPEATVAKAAFDAQSSAIPALQVTQLTVAYRDQPVLWNVSLRVEAGQLLAIVGPNGAGKSTLLKAILGLVKPLHGHVQLLGQSLKQVRGKVTYVPQRSTVDWDFPTTVLDVVVMGTYGGLGWLRRPGQAEYRRAQEALAQVEMTAYSSRPISHLSGGQQQRVFLARALVQNPLIYLLDEPFQGVDAVTEKASIALFRQLRSAGKTIIAVHHDLATVRTYFDSVSLLNVRSIATGNVEDVFTDSNIQLTYDNAELNRI